MGYTIQLPEEAEEPKVPGKYRIEFPDEVEKSKIPGYLKTGGRQLARSGARAVETLLGAPRAVGEFLESLVPERALKKGVRYLGLEKPAEKALELTKKYAPYKLFPTSEQIREDITKNLFGEKLEPQSPAEELSDEIVSDIAALSIPVTGEFKLLRPVLMGLGANIAGEAAKKLGGGERAKTYTKLGTMLLGSLIRPRQLQKFKNDLYKQAESLVPENASTPFDLGKLQDLKEKIMKGGSAPSKKIALQTIEELQIKAGGGQLPIDEATAFKRTINENLGSLYKQLEGNKVGIRTAKKYLGDVSQILDESLEKYGDINPEWEAFYRPANEVHGAVINSKRVSNFIEKTYKKFRTPGLLALFKIETAIGLPKIAAGTAAGYPILKTGELLARIFKSPVLRNYYFNVLKTATQENATALSENLEKLDKALVKSQ